MKRRYKHIFSGEKVTVLAHNDTYVEYRKDNPVIIQPEGKPFAEAKERYEFIKIKWVFLKVFTPI